MQSNSSYITIDGQSDYASVSQILASDPRKKAFYKSRGAERKKRGLDSDGVAVGRHRGESLHKTFADYLLTGECDCSPVYMGYWDQLYSFISPLSLKPVWIEGPLNQEHSFLKSGDTSLIWSAKYKYCGRPDLITDIEGVMACVEIKTSRTPYSKNFDHRKFLNFSEFYNYSRAAQQVAAYSHAWTERTGQKIDCGIVINVMPDALQFFTVEYPEMQLRLKNFRSLARQYHKTH